MHGGKGTAQAITRQFLASGGLPKQAISRQFSGLLEEESGSLSGQPVSLVRLNPGRARVVDFGVTAEKTGREPGHSRRKKEGKGALSV